MSMGLPPVLLLALWAAVVKHLAPGNAHMIHGTSFFQKKNVGISPATAQHHLALRLLPGVDVAVGADLLQPQGANHGHRRF